MIDCLGTRKTTLEKHRPDLDRQAAETARTGLRAADYCSSGAPFPGPALQHGGMAARRPRWPSAATFLLPLLLPLWVGLLSPPARADVSASLHCHAGTVLVRTDSKTCPTERGRPAAAVQRACCQGRNGKLRCMRYPECPTRSPS